MGSPIPRKATEQEALLQFQQGMGQIAAELGQVKTTLELAKASRIISKDACEQLYAGVCKLYEDAQNILISAVDAEENAARKPVPIIHHPMNQHQNKR